MACSGVRACVRVCVCVCVSVRVCVCVYGGRGWTRRMKTVGESLCIPFIIYHCNVLQKVFLVFSVITVFQMETYMLPIA